MSDAAKVLNLLRARGQTLSVAESITAGLVSARLTDVPNSSSVFKGGIVAYSDQSKRMLLGIPSDILDQHSAVSEQCCQLMAIGARTAFGTDWAIATTGYAGSKLCYEESNTEAAEHDGLVFIHVVGPNASTSEGQLLRFDRENTRDENRQSTVVKVLDLLYTMIERS
ncbi:competence-damage inducible protein [Obelidium mucronatum]|nr:competence-damage inducible protein [Obelidium mucronatum]